MRSLCQEACCLTHNIHIRILLHQQSIKDIQRTRYLLAIDLSGSSNWSKADQLIQDMMQASRDQKTFQESVNERTKCSRRSKKTAKSIDDHIKYRPYEEHKQSQERDRHNHHDRNETLAAEETECYRKLCLMETVVDHCRPKTNNDTAKNTHAIGEDTHNSIISRILLRRFK